MAAAAAEADFLVPGSANSKDTTTTPAATAAAAGETRPRKRRRRTVACTQCRTRKLKCDREYPTCGRCLKSGIRDLCKYEESFVWQQPNTVTASTTNSNSTSNSTLASPGVVAVHDPLNNNTNRHAHPPATATLPTLPTLPALSANGVVTKEHPPVLPAFLRLVSAPPPTSSHNNDFAVRQSEISRTRFLDTVLAGPKPSVTANYPRPNREAMQQQQQQQQQEEEEEQEGQTRGQQRALATPSQRLELVNKVMIRGKETRTRFGGGGIVSNLMLQFPELSSFLREVKANNPNVSRIRMAKDALKSSSVQSKLKETLPATISTATLLALLPAKPVVDLLLRLYMVYVESMHRVVHIPSFRRELAEMQANISHPDLISAAFVAQLLLMLAAAVGFYQADPSAEYEDPSISNTFQVVEWIRYAEKWIETTYIKRFDLVVLRIRCLLIIAKTHQGMGRNQLWLATGNLVKMAVLAGYHRDPRNNSKISVFNKEMRRRIWATIVELDTQVAVDRGMPPTLQASDFDTAPPLNINDDEIHENITEEPQSRPLHEMTDCSFQVVLTQSLPLRLRIFSLMNSPVISCCYEDILGLEWELGRFQAGLPPWQSSSNDRDGTHQQQALLLTAVLETKMSQALLAIHTPFAIEAKDDPLFEPSSRARLEVAVVIVSRHLKLHETSARLSYGHPVDSTLQASLSILQHLKTRRNGYTSDLLRQVIPELTESLLHLVERAISCLEARLLWVVKGAKQFIFLYMIFALVKAELYPDQADEIKIKIADRILATTYRLLRGGKEAAPQLDAVTLSNSHVPSLNSGIEAFENIPGSYDSNNLSDLMMTPSDDFNSLLQVLDWEDFSAFPFSM